MIQFLTIAALLLSFAVLAIANKSSLRLALALRHQKKMTGDVPVENLQIDTYGACRTNSFLDDLWGWAGHVEIRRQPGNVFTAVCVLPPHRSGPVDTDALYINGKKFSALQSAIIPFGAELIQLQRYTMQPARHLRIVGLNC